MPKSYSREYLDRLNILRNTAWNKPGIQLANVCVHANLPLINVAEIFQVSRMTVHSWFRGKYIREKNVRKIEKFIQIIEWDTEIGLLPASNPRQAKLYLEKNIKEHFINNLGV